jgi:hypothetical protein
VHPLLPFPERVPRDVGFGSARTVATRDPLLIAFGDLVRMARARGAAIRPTRAA